MERTWRDISLSSPLARIIPNLFLPSITKAKKFSSNRSHFYLHCSFLSIPYSSQYRKSYANDSQNFEVNILVMQNLKYRLCVTETDRIYVQMKITCYPCPWSMQLPPREERMPTPARKKRSSGDYPRVILGTVPALSSRLHKANPYGSQQTTRKQFVILAPMPPSRECDTACRASSASLYPIWNFQYALPPRIVLRGIRPFAILVM